MMTAIYIACIAVGVLLLVTNTIGLARDLKRREDE
jgi:hypothetical protein